MIREQNKKISRLPSLSAKDPVGSDNKDTIPRRKVRESHSENMSFTKSYIVCLSSEVVYVCYHNYILFFVFFDQALEYARTIAKPKPPPNPKDRPGEQNVNMLPHYPQEMDPYHLVTLEMLRRHEEEKRAVARLRNIHAI